MRIPTEQELEEYISASANVGAVAASTLASRDACKWTSIPSTEALAEYLTEYWEALAVRVAQVDLLPAAEWLTRSTAAKRAIRALHGRQRAATAFDAWEQAKRLIDGAATSKTWPDRVRYWSPTAHSEETIAERVAYANSPETINDRFERSLRAFTERNWLCVAQGIAEALNGYLYLDAYKKYVVRPDAHQKAARKLLAALDTLESAELWSACGVSAPGRSFSLHRRRASEVLERADRTRSPIGRVDATVRERALAFELWRLFRTHFRANKTNAVFNFLLLDGIENPPVSEKPVEAWVKSWREGHSVSYPR